MKVRWLDTNKNVRTGEVVAFVTSSEGTKVVVVENFGVNLREVNIKDVEVVSVV